MDPDLARLVTAVRVEMDARGWRQQDLADHADISVRSVRYLLSPRLTRPPNNMWRIERALGWQPGTASAIARGESPPPVGKADRTPPSSSDEPAEEPSPLTERMRVFTQMIRNAPTDDDALTWWRAAMTPEERALADRLERAWQAGELRRDDTDHAERDVG